MAGDALDAFGLVGEALVLQFVREFGTGVDYGVSPRLVVFGGAVVIVVDDVSERFDLRSKGDLAGTFARQTVPPLRVVLIMMRITENAAW